MRPSSHVVSWNATAARTAASGQPLTTARLANDESTAVWWVSLWEGGMETTEL